MLRFEYSEEFFVSFDGRVARLLNTTEHIRHIVSKHISVVLCRLQASLLEPGLNLRLPIILVNIRWPFLNLLIPAHRIISVSVHLGNEEL